jgi:hypothetical protein
MARIIKSFQPNQKLQDKKWKLVQNIIFAIKNGRNDKKVMS